MYRIKIQDTSVIFGKNSHVALNLLKKGASKNEIVKETGCTVGVNRANLEVKRGELFVVMGLSGSGKSTLLRCINRLIEPTEGKIIVDDEDVTAAEPEKLRGIRREKMSMVFQHFGLLPHRTVISNVAFGLEIQGMEQEARYKKAEEVINTVGLGGNENMMTGELSGGMQQRVGLARALTTDPEILLMDEAFSALDPLIRTNLQEELLDLQEKLQKTIVFITHDLDEAIKLGDRITIMNEGSIVQTGTPEEILTDPANDYVKAFVENVDRGTIVTARTIMDENFERIRIKKDGPQTALRKMKHSGINVLPLVSESEKFRGFITDSCIEKMLKSGSTDFLEYSCSKDDVNAVYTDTPASEMLPFFLKTDHPLAVVDNGNQLKGLVAHSAVIGEMVDKKEHEMEQLIDEKGVDYEEN